MIEGVGYGILLYLKLAQALVIPDGLLRHLCIGI